MRIAVCDDEPLICKEVTRRIQDLSSEDEIFTYHNGQALLDSGKVFDLIFLDVDMPELGGMETAAVLCKKQRDTLIIFLTASREHIHDAFKVRAFRYICKPVKQEDFEEAFLSAKDEMSERIKISVRQDHITCSILLNNVICFEAYGDGTYVYTTEGVYTSARPLRSWLSEIGTYCFYQVHRSYAVSLRHIQSINTNAIIMRGMQQEIPISRRSRSGVKEAFLLYMRENAR